MNSSSVAFVLARKGYQSLCHFKSKLLGKFAAFLIPLLSKYTGGIPWKTTLSSMRKLPKTSLGWAMASMLDKEGHSLIPKFETHDVQHLLLGYQMTGLGEARLQFFLVGNGHKTLISIGTCLFSLAVFPELFSLFHKDYQRGKTFTNLSSIDFQHLLSNDMEEIQARIKRTTLTF